MNDAKSSAYRICARCVMDTSDPEIDFDEAGVCKHCRDFDAKVKPNWRTGAEGRESLERLVEAMKAAGKGRDYDCIMGLSGGVDSSYLAYLSQEWGLRTLAVHVDGGWNSELAVRNIELIVKKCRLDLFTHVVNWLEMKDLQRAYMRSGLANQDVPQDHVFFATLYQKAAKEGIRYILTGSNYATESVLPSSWGYNAMDAKQLRAVHKIFGSIPLKTYNTHSLLRYCFLDPFVYRLRVLKPLNCLPYDKAEAKKLLMERLGWKDYGVKHGESRFTRFFQNHWLPERFGYDKRRAHFSSLVLAGTMTRDEALEELKKPFYDPAELREDRLFVMKKLGFSEEEMEALLHAPRAYFRQYPSNYALMERLRRLKGLAVSLGLLKR